MKNCVARPGYPGAYRPAHSFDFVAGTSENLLMASDDKKNDGMTTVPAPVTETLILICEKCGKKQVSDDEENPSRTIQLALKEHIKSSGKKGVLRAVVTSCMDICPKDEIAVGLVGLSPTNDKKRFFTFRGKPKHAVEAILENLKS